MRQLRLGCFGGFDFDLQIDGTYHVKAKVLLWNDHVELIKK
jgi:hypothetical protein